jgi:hypothetical protein
MFRKCPSCDSDNVRRSSTPASDVTWRNHVLSRYRCRDCKLQFWVISRKAYVAGAALLAAIAVAIFAVFLLDLILNQAPSPTKKSRRSDAGQPVRVHVAGNGWFGVVARETTLTRLRP